MNFRLVAKAIAEVLNTVKSVSGKDDVDGEDIATIVVTVAVGSYLDLPSGPVDRIDDYYTAHVYPTVEAIIGGLNEGHMPVDVMSTMRAVKAYYITRYNMVFDATSKAALECTWNVMHNTGNTPNNSIDSWTNLYKASSSVPNLMKKVVDSLNDKSF